MLSLFWDDFKDKKSFSRLSCSAQKRIKWKAWWNPWEVSPLQVTKITFSSNENLGEWHRVPRIMEICRCFEKASHFDVSLWRGEAAEVEARVGTFWITKRTHKMEQGAEFNHAQIKVEALCNVKRWKRSRCWAASNTEKSHQKSMDERQNSFGVSLGLSKWRREWSRAYKQNIKKVNRQASAFLLSPRWKIFSVSRFPQISRTINVSFWRNSRQTFESCLTFRADATCSPPSISIALNPFEKECNRRWNPFFSTWIQSIVLR